MAVRISTSRKSFFQVEMVDCAPQTCLHCIAQTILRSNFVLAPNYKQFLFDLNQRRRQTNRLCSRLNVVLQKSILRFLLFRLHTYTHTHFVIESTERGEHQLTAFRFIQFSSCDIKRVQIPINKALDRSLCILFYLPQNGIPSGIQMPLSQTRRAGPNNSNPRSHVYDATVPLCNVSSENTMELCAGEPGKLHDFCAVNRNKSQLFTDIMNKYIRRSSICCSFLFFFYYIRLQYVVTNVR